jgi:hypothetical protein
VKRLLAASLALALSGPASADTATGSANCTIVAQAAANTVAARIQADDSNIHDPIGVRNLTCLDNFFNGLGLNLVANILDPATLLGNVEGKICSLVTSTLHSLIGSAQCGLTITGFSLGGFGIGGGSFCPKLSIGGGGPTWATFGAGPVGSGGGGFYLNGTGLRPTGYPAQPNSGTY